MEGVLEEASGGRREGVPCPVLRPHRQRRLYQRLRILTRKNAVSDFPVNFLSVLRIQDEGREICPHRRSGEKMSIYSQFSNAPPYTN